MSGLPTSAFDDFGSLFALSVQAKDGQDVKREIADVKIARHDPLETKVLAAVQLHLLLATDLAHSRTVDRANWTAISFYWDASLVELKKTFAPLTPRSHAFHMRLASKYADYYRSLDQKELENWIRACRLKSEFLAACALYQGGADKEALAHAEKLSHDWRQTLPVRLRGLYDIERTTSAWAAASGDDDAAVRLLERANQGTGRSSPYDDDEPDLWKPPRTIESTVRFAFAATVIPVQLIG